jgi:hypothetical protein
MQLLTEKTLLLSPPGSIVEMTAVRNLFPDLSEGARRVLLHRAVRARELIRLKRGLFLLQPELRKSNPHPFVVAALLHSPSHISLESALSHHGLIPEALYQVASVTAARSRVFETPIGKFSFQRVPALDPRAGVQAVKLGQAAWAFIASPLRAIADLVYLRPSVSWEKEGMDFLTDSLRMEEEDLAKLDFSLGERIMESIRNRRVREFLQGLRKELGG